MKAFHKQKQGFTIVELIVVVFVIGIMAAIIVVSFGTLQRRANESASAAAVSTANKKLDVYKISNRFYPNALSDAEVYNYANTTYQYTLDPSKISYCVTATTNKVSMFGSAADPEPTKGGCTGHAVDGVTPLTNYVLNPSFENGSLAPNWPYAAGTGFAYAITTTKKAAGTYAGAATVSTTTAADSYFYTTTAALPKAGTYYVSAQVYITSAANTFTNTTTTCTNNNFDLRLYGGSSTVSACYNRAALNSWQKVSTTVTVAAGASLQLKFYPPVASGAVMYIDNVMVTNGVTNYADGDSSGWGWLGATYGSASSGPAL